MAPGRLPAERREPLKSISGAEGQMCASGAQTFPFSGLVGRLSPNKQMRATDQLAVHQTEEHRPESCAHAADMITAFVAIRIKTAFIMTTQ